MGINITYEDLVSWLEKPENNASGQKIRQEAENNPPTQLLISLIDECRSMVQSAMLNKPDAVLSYEQIDELLTRLLAAPTESDARQFLGQLRFLPAFFRKLSIRLELISEEVNVAEISKISQQFGYQSPTRENLLNIVPTLQQQGFVCNENPAKNIVSMPVFNWQRWTTAAAAVFLIGVISFWSLTDTNSGYMGIYDDQLPYKFSQFELMPMEQLRSQSGLRSSSQSLEGNFQALAAVMTTSRENYEAFRYSGMVKSLENFQPVAAILEDQVAKASVESDNVDREMISQTQRLLQEYHFTLGLGYLALSTSAKAAPDESSRKTFQQQAIANFGKAKNLAEKFALQTSGREIFYTGLAERFRGEIELAKSYFEQIPPESIFYEQAQEELGDL